jgi:2-amino-4-hydroxy-6-hydroxymethyldihydropteridine diphosphokinase
MASNMLHDKHALLLLGGNRDDTPLLFTKVVEILNKSGCQIIKSSSSYKSESWGFEAAQPFINRVVELKWNSTPELLLETILNIETILGRQRNASGKYESRNIDIDILFFGNRIIHTSTLEIPHPRIHLRRFTLVPLCEHWENLMHPSLKMSISKLLEQCDDNGTVEQI